MIDIDLVTGIMLANIRNQMKPSLLTGQGSDSSKID
jgi:hypothetical protein